jgi:hypothetical protein
MRAEDIVWPGGEHPFRLDLGGLRAVQAATGRGPMDLLTALRDGSWKLDDIIAPLRHGLEGGGMPDAEAKALVLRLVQSDPLISLVPAASLVMSIAIFGAVDEQTERTGEDAGETAGGPAPAN